MSENRSDWFLKVRNLVLSVRTSNTSISDAPLTVNLVGGIDERVWRPLRELGVDLRVVQPFDVRFPHANKLRMFENDALLSAVDVLIAVDCDVFLGSDPVSLFPVDAVSAKPEDQSILSDDHWLSVYRHMSIEPPLKNCRLTSSGELSYPWWNSGVLGVPTSLAPRLHSRWVRNVPQVGGLVEDGTLPANWVTDQVAFACALLMEDIPFQELPVIANYPVPYPVHPEVRSSCPDPAVFVHFHHSINAKGFVDLSSDPVVDRQIAAFNLTLQGHTGATYRPRAAGDRSGAIGSPAITGLQRRLAQASWYRSPRLRPWKRRAVNSYLWLRSAARSRRS